MEQMSIRYCETYFANFSVKLEKVLFNFLLLKYLSFLRFSVDRVICLYIFGLWSFLDTELTKVCRPVYSSILTI